VTAAEAALRPLSFSDFVGQAKTIERLQVMVGAARKRGDPLNHILLSGPPGLAPGRPRPRPGRRPPLRGPPGRRRDL